MWQLKAITPAGETVTVLSDTPGQVVLDYHDQRARGRDVEILDEAGNPVDIADFDLGEAG